MVNINYLFRIGNIEQILGITLTKEQYLLLNAVKSFELYSDKIKSFDGANLVVPSGDRKFVSFILIAEQCMNSGLVITMQSDIDVLSLFCIYRTTSKTYNLSRTEKFQYMLELRDFMLKYYSKTHTVVYTSQAVNETETINNKLTITPINKKENHG